MWGTGAQVPARDEQDALTRMGQRLHARDAMEAHAFYPPPDIA